MALGGNAILQPGQKGTAGEQIENVKKTAEQIAWLIERGYKVLITHGNGPQVGNIMIQNQAARDKVPCMPMDIAGAESQGMIGYMMQMYIRNALLKRGIKKTVVSIVTQSLVSRDDPAFLNPSKPVGPFYDRDYALEREREFGEKWIEDSGRGWRRVVPSPDPIEIIEAPCIKSLVRDGHIVISAGGGGIPVVCDEQGMLSGVEAVIDKDLAAERLATQVGADILMILTDVNGAAINYGTPQEKWLRNVTLDEMKAYQSQGHFKSGSMGPKVKAVIRFLENGGKKGIIASLYRAVEALQGSTGTIISKD